MNAPFRWADLFANPPLACTLDVRWDDGASDLALSLDRPISPSDIHDFPYLTKTLAPVEDPSSNNPFAAELDELLHDSVVPMTCLIRSVGIQDEYRLVRLERDADSGLCDDGANICMGPGRDRTKLRRIGKIKPIPIGMAMKSEQPESIMMIEEMGYYPIPLLDRTECEVPCLLNERATDFIFSPDALVKAHPDFATWIQVGHRDNRPGQFQILDRDGAVRLELPLRKQNGL